MLRIFFVIRRVPQILCLGIFVLPSLLLPFAPSLHAQDHESSIRALLIERDTEIKAVLANEPLDDAEIEELREIVNGLINFERMGKTILGKLWAEISPARQTEFITVFGAIVREQSLGDLDPYRAIIGTPTVEVFSDSARASSTALWRNVSTNVDYDLVLTDANWQIVDISIDGVSTVGGYSRSFRSAIRKRGFDGLMTSLYKRLDRITK